jgi:hypothetical protein
LHLAIVCSPTLALLLSLFVDKEAPQFSKSPYLLFLS